MTVDTCRTFTETVTDHLEGALDSETDASFLLHVESCPGCAIYLGQLRLTVDALRHLR